MKLSKKIMILSVSSGLVAFGLAGSLPEWYFHRTHLGSVPTQALASKPVAVTPGVPLITGKPVSISIPSVQINVPVIDGSYNKTTNQWTLTLDKAQFATMSVMPNNLSGDTFIYGHYRPEVFAYLHHIKPGATAVITTDNGYQFTYTFNKTYATQPTDTSVLDYQGPPLLTVQTCSGTWFQNRQMYLFAYDGYKKA